MILQKEIADIAAQKGVVKSTIDKDWALGHFIDAIFFEKSIICKIRTYLPYFAGEVTIYIHN
jgi:hypothetical protein